MASTGYSAAELQKTQNVTPFPSKRVELDQTTTNYDHDDHDNNNYNNNHARAREEKYKKALLEQSIRDIGESFEDVFGRPMPRAIENEVRRMIDSGIDSTLITEVINYTAGAPRPSWAYARAVIMRNYQKGVNSWMEFSATLRDRVNTSF